MVSVPEPLLLALLIDQIRNSVEQGAGGVQLDKSKLIMIIAAARKTDFLNENIMDLQIVVSGYSL